MKRQVEAKPSHWNRRDFGSQVQQTLACQYTQTHTAALVAKREYIKLSTFANEAVTKKTKEGITPGHSSSSATCAASSTDWHL